MSRSSDELEIRLIYDGLMAVYDSNGDCLGSIVKSKDPKYELVLFSYDTASLYYGATCAEAVREFYQAEFASRL